MTNNPNTINEFHWLLDLVQTVDVGIVVINSDYEIKLWNGFMENHSGTAPSELLDKNLFHAFPELDANWLKQKIESVFLLKNRSFISWEQRPYVFKFKNYRPITGRAEHMYQNVTLQPLLSPTGKVTSISIIIYDVTDMAIKKLQLNQANQILERLSQTDELTQLQNRRQWQQCLEREFERFTRYQSPASLVMLDIDHFKAVNDNYGHQMGDTVIQRVAHTITQTLRETDCAGRYGGEEFGVILAGTSAEDALHFTERLRKSVETLTFTTDDEQTFSVSISLGICTINDNIRDISHLISLADKALYRAKLSGRNRSVIYRDTDSEKNLH
ncbi:diguanylate cyclase [Parashewanella curva]|uniref:diguanylate cyclase n=1 Tax=Parashewanella curva TaxID=2338552 RepID=A0A3L8Q247_9GAMM|nr:diguanylate cyclase [Parashewanella curva]RLV60928.1 diguanylate cyclase [Parashewanella curva]